MNKQKRIPYNIIVEAKNGDVVAMQKILRHYETYINHFSKRPVRNGDGTYSDRIDPSVKEEIEAHLMRAIILHFNYKYSGARCVIVFGANIAIVPILRKGCEMRGF